MGTAIAEHNKRFGATLKDGNTTPVQAMERVAAASGLSGEPLYRALLEAAHAGRAGIHAAACGMGQEQ